MTSEWRFTVPGVPQPKERPRVGRAGGLTKAQRAERLAAKAAGKRWIDPRAAVVRTPVRTCAFEMRVAAAAQEAGVRAGDAECAVTIDVWLPRPDVRLDLDNVGKSVLDGLVKAGRMALADDDHRVVAELTVRRAGYDPAAPRTVVTITTRGA